MVLLARLRRVIRVHGRQPHRGGGDEDWLDGTVFDSKGALGYEFRGAWC